MSNLNIAFIGDDEHNGNHHAIAHDYDLHTSLLYTIRFSLFPAYFILHSPSVSYIFIILWK